MTRVLILGSGAREHSLAWRLSEDAGVEVFCAPGNAGTALVAKNLSLDPMQSDAVIKTAHEHKINLVVVGPEAPLVAGIADALRAQKVAVFGPSRAAAQLEGSKAFSKEFMARHKIPTAAFQVFDNADAAESYIKQAQRALVVKADGLAAGKGVIVSSNTEEALQAIDQIMRKEVFGAAGARVVVEDCLVGEEVSYHVVSDGKNLVPLAPAQDHKRALDGDRGPNTGGMGAYSPPAIVDAAIEKKILERVVTPTLRGMEAEGNPFAGALFVGLMIVKGEPIVLEYNVRFGDPECEAMLVRWGGPLLPLLMGAARGELAGFTTSWRAPASLCVVLASGGYPGDYQTGKVISGLDRAADISDVYVFHAGTRVDGEQVVTSGGRVLTLSASGTSIDEAAARAYHAADLIEFEGKHLRRDIGYRARTK